MRDGALEKSQAQRPPSDAKHAKQLISDHCLRQHTNVRNQRAADVRNGVSVRPLWVRSGP